MATAPKPAERPNRPRRAENPDPPRGIVLQELLQNSRSARSAGKQRRELGDFIEWALPRTGKAKAQLFQDLWVQWELGEKRGGYFCEFGATNGLDLSNTHLLEKEYGWGGVLIEPNPIHHTQLYRERSCHISEKCVFSVSGQEVAFNCTEIAHLSRMVDVVPDDSHEHQGRRIPQQIIEVETISLNDLLTEVGAPDHIDYISADTEGSEYDILSQFDFARRRVGTITVEHNFTPIRARLHDLLSRQGYIRRFEDFSRFDDWYIHREVMQTR